MIRENFNQSNQNYILRAVMDSMKHSIESKLGYQINKTVMKKLKNGTFPEPTNNFKQTDNLSIASTQESVNHHNIEIFENGRFQMKNIRDQEVKLNDSQMATEVNNQTVYGQDRRCRVSSAYQFAEPIRNKEGVFNAKANMPSFIQKYQLAKTALNVTQGDQTAKRTSVAGLMKRVSVVGSVANVSVGGGDAGSLSGNKTPRITDIQQTIEPAEEIRISNTKRIRTSNPTTQTKLKPINIEALPSAIQKRATPIMKIFEQFETKCITSGLLNRTQSAEIQQYFQQLLAHCLPVINSDLRYQHSEPVSAVLLMFAWEKTKLPIKKFLKTINACTKKDLGRVGIIRRCKAFTVVKKLKHQIDRIEAL
jgi:hypothetical protein